MHRSLSGERSPRYLGKYIWTRVICGLDENIGLGCITVLVRHTSWRCGFTTFDRSIR